MIWSVPLKNSQCGRRVSEGIADAGGTFICEYSDAAKLDSFGHKMLTGCGEVLESFVRDRFHVKVRSIELNVSQRCSGMLASRTDIEESAMAGAFGVRAALSGETGKMAAFQRISDVPYELSCCLEPVGRICNQEKKFPAEWISEGGSDVTDSFLPYILPLIQGEPEPDHGKRASQISLPAARRGRPHKALKHQKNRMPFLSGSHAGLPI